MFRCMTILSTLLMLVKTQFHLYRTGRIDLYYDCLYYRIRNDVDFYGNFENNFNSYEVIPYCIRPFEEREDDNIVDIRGNVALNLTFDALKQRNISSQDLLAWSAPIELAERYENFLNLPNKTAALEIFYNCTSSWFGPLCQYTFDSNKTIDQIVRETFLAKEESGVDKTNIQVTNLTCYVHLECNRGPPPICFDWREICDGRIDCIGTGIDEIGCLKLEANECDENEYRCHRGMCVPREFLNDNSFNPDCLDRTDENDDNALKTERTIGFNLCFQDPAFRCEESDYFLGLRGFVCGDGQYIQIAESQAEASYLTPEFRCRNNRDKILYRSALLDIRRSSMMSLKCFLALSCLILYRDEEFCVRETCGNEGYFCPISLQTVCNHSKYVLFPVLPVLQGYAQFGFWTNKTIKSFTTIPLPDFVCYDPQRCPFLSSGFRLDNLTCSSIRQMGLIVFEHLLMTFHLCLPMDSSGNETDCFHPSLFHCPRSSKCISKHRLVDGVVDCSDFADEDYTETCQLNQTDRFQCSSENTCLASVLVQDNIRQCDDGEDELSDFRREFSFPDFCNGSPQLPAMIIDGQKVNDETNCTHWPCNNEYTRCDLVWDCYNGADELNCDSESECNPDAHECVSPNTSEIICLPVHRAGDDVIDCLGSTDERGFCRATYFESSLMRYQCWDEPECTFGGCKGLLLCQFDGDFFSDKVCEQYSKIDRILRSPTLDQFVRDWKARHNLYFTLIHLDRISRINTNFSTEMIEGDDHSSLEVPYTHNESLQAWVCNRGILVYRGLGKAEYCFCPPSYYGDRCQFQSQRVSLTIQFRKECAPVCRGIYAIVVMLVDSDNQIHSHDRFTYVSTDHCDMKYNIYLLYQTRKKSLSKNYTIRIIAYNKMDLSYYTSWILPVKFLFLPVNRIAALLVIPAHAVDATENCPLKCGVHGRCAVHGNVAEYYCRCELGWSGTGCTIQLDGCDCSSDSICLGIEDDRWICLCPVTKTGPSCILPSVCRSNPCQNDGQCVADDHQISPDAFKCICKESFSGRICEVRDTQIDISFHDTEIPQSLFLHLITVRDNDNPLIATKSAKIAFNRDITTVYTSLAFNLIFIQIIDEYYLTFVQVVLSYQRSHIFLLYFVVFLHTSRIVKRLKKVQVLP